MVKETESIVSMKVLESAPHKLQRFDFGINHYFNSNTTNEGS